MKVFLKYFAIPLGIAVIAAILFVVDSLIAPNIFAGASFMWVAFVSWTIFYSVSVKERIKGLIGLVIGFLLAVVMMLISGSFSVNLYTISLSGLLGVFCVNFFVMYFEKAGKWWLNSMSGIFGGIFVTFSGLGINLSPISSTANFFIMLGIILLYSVFGMICGYFSTLISNKTKEKLKNFEESAEKSQKEDD